MREILSCAAAFALPPALLVGWGFLIGRFLLTRRTAPLLPWLAPALGLAFVASVGPAAGAIGLPLRLIAWPMAILAVPGWFVAYRAGGWSRWVRTHGLALAVAATGLLIAVIPLLLLGRLTTVGSSIDAISYNVRSEFVLNHGLHRPQIEAGKPYLGWVAAQIDLLRVGDVYWLGLVSWLLGRRSFEMMTVIAAFGHAASTFGTYFFTRAGLGQRRRTACLAAAFVAVNNTLIWPVLDCSLSQVLALALIPATLATAGILLRRPSPRLAVTVGVLLSALAAIYPVFLLLVAGTLGVLELLALFRFPLPGRRAARLTTGAIAAVTAIAVNPVGSLRALRELGFIGGMLGKKGIAAVGMGNILVFPPAAELFGLVGHAAAAHGIARWGVPALAAQALAVAAALLASFALIRLGKARRAPAMALAIVGVGLALHQRFIVNPPHGYPYGYFKAITVIAVLLAALLAVGLDTLARSNRGRLVSVALMAGLLGTSSLYAAWTVLFAETQVIATSDLLNAANAVRQAAGSHAIEVDVTPGPKENWLGYLLSDSLVVFKRTNVIHPVITPPLAEAPRFVLTESSTAPGGTGGPQPDSRPTRRLWSGGGFEVREFLDSLIVEWPGPPTSWSKGQTLRVTPGAGGLAPTLDLGDQRWPRPLTGGRARTLQLTLSAASPSRLEISGEVLDVGAGTWLLDVDLACPLPLDVVLEAGTLTPGPTRLLRDVTGSPGRCVELLPSPLGLFAWRQRIEGPKLIVDADVIPPAQTSPHLYRLGLHVGGGLPGHHDWYGVWGVDFPGDGRVHHVVMEVDLQKREGRAEMDGTNTTILQSNRDASKGQFEASLVLWRLDPISQLYAGRALTFEIGADSELRLHGSPGEGRRWWRIF
jgi:hypothetical protein